MGGGGNKEKGIGQQQYRLKRLCLKVLLVVPSTRRMTLSDRTFPVRHAEHGTTFRSANDQGLTVAADVPPTTYNIPFSYNILVT